MLHKYPRTPHLVGSQRQPGDEELPAVALSDLAGPHLVVEEKLDGANCAISFTARGALQLQSRGHFLTGGPREAQFGLLKAWAATHQARLLAVLGSRYVMYGEWLFAKHTIYYDELSHYFVEYDVLDVETGEFLSTARRNTLLSGLPPVSAPVLDSGLPDRAEDLTVLIGPSRFKSTRWRERLTESCIAQAVDCGQTFQQTDPLMLMEGLYIKVEDDRRVASRCKFVRSSFLSSVAASGGHWLDRPIVPNRLREGVDMFAEAL